jgi:hypothetical protein
VYKREPAHMTKARAVSAILVALPAGRAEISRAILIKTDLASPSQVNLNIV